MFVGVCIGGGCMNKTPNYLEFTDVLSEDTIESVRGMKDEREGSGGVEGVINKLSE